MSEEVIRSMESLFERQLPELLLPSASVELEQRRAYDGIIDEMMDKLSMDNEALRRENRELRARLYNAEKRECWLTRELLARESKRVSPSIFWWLDE